MPHKAHVEKFVKSSNKLRIKGICNSPSIRLPRQADPLLRGLPSHRTPGSVVRPILAVLNSLYTTITKWNRIAKLFPWMINAYKFVLSNPTPHPFISCAHTMLKAVRGLARNSPI